MVTPQLKEYAQNQLASGMTEDALRSTLAIQGWAQNDIDEVFSTAPGAAAGSLLSQTIESPTPEDTAATETPPASAPVTHSKLTTIIAISVLGLLIVGGGFYAYTHTKKVAAIAPSPSPSE